ncbi:MAG: N-acetyltransferase family protein [Pseudomonadota bacterium]
MIRPATKDDARQIAEIYGHYVRTTSVSFEEDPPSSDQMAERIETTSRDYPYLVDEEGGQLSGYCYAGLYRTRSAYRFTAETTVYVRDDARGSGVGRALYARLIEALKKQDLHLLVGAITLPNPASEALHRSFGFERAGHLKEVGFKFGRWHDVALWQLRLAS